MKKYILGFVSILLLVAVSGCFKGGGERIQKKLSKELSLNDSQKKTLLSSFEELQKLQTQSQEILNSMRDSIAAEVGKENFSTNSISKNIQSQIDKLNKNSIPSFFTQRMFKEKRISKSSYIALNIRFTPQRMFKTPLLG